MPKGHENVELSRYAIHAAYGRIVSRMLLRSENSMEYGEASTKWSANPFFLKKL